MDFISVMVPVRRTYSAVVGQSLCRCSGHVDTPKLLLLACYCVSACLPSTQHLPSQQSVAAVLMGVATSPPSTPDVPVWNVYVTPVIPAECFPSSETQLQCLPAASLDSPLAWGPLNLSMAHRAPPATTLKVLCGYHYFIYQ